MSQYSEMPVPTPNDQIKLTKLHTNPKKGYKLGSASATWKKIKSATSSTSETQTPSSTTSSTSTNTINSKEDELDSSDYDESSSSSFSSSLSTPLLEYGSHGQLFLTYPDVKLIEIWDWKPRDHNTTSSSYSSTSSSTNSSSIPKLDSDTLFLHHQFKVGANTSAKKDAIKLVKVIHESTSSTTNTNYDIIIILKNSVDNKYYLELHKFNPSYTNESSSKSQSFELPSILSHPVSIKTSNKFIIIGDQSGLLLVYRYDINNNKILPGNVDSNLFTIRKSSSLPILSKLNIINKFPDDEILLQTSCNLDKTPIFDIIDNWLVYAPSSFEYKHLLAVNAATLPSQKDNNLRSENERFTDGNGNDLTNRNLDPIITNYNYDRSDHNTSTSPGSYSTLFTPVKLPASGPLLNKVLSSLSKTALDGLYRFSEMSSLKVKSLMNPPSSSTGTTSPISNSVNSSTIDSISSSIGKLLYSTASTTAATLQKTIIKTTSGTIVNDNQLIKIVDLANDRVLGIIKPPGGVSNVSLSPYDLQLVSVNYRGDSLYMWDLYRLPLEMSLIGKFERGKTSAIIEEIFWFMHHVKPPGNGINKDEAIYGNNLGFGCISKNSGSVHWFNINYLSGTLNNNHNYPNRLEMKKVRRLRKKKMKTRIVNKMLGGSLKVSDGDVTNSESTNHTFDNTSGTTNTTTTTTTTTTATNNNSNNISNNNISTNNPSTNNNSKSSSSNKGQFLDSWILSSFKAKKFIGLPNVANDESGYFINQLAVITKDNCLKLISPLNGSHLFKYELPLTYVNENAVPRSYSNPVSSVINSGTTSGTINPLSQAEIETCAPFLNLVNNSNVEFAIYDFESDQHDGDGFYNHFQEFGNDIPVKIISFNNSNNNNNNSSKYTTSRTASGSASSGTNTLPINDKIDESNNSLSLLNGLYIDPATIDS
ncbi:uncharacterized protein RJT21DRAFT_112831 [Scheffersomyces amazonensis]|uniref:uncharacterized protein n=1 Tax=Scheffersomyces amazonensis TaxID=1078765 RepID=UPI00315D6099